MSTDIIQLTSGRSIRANEGIIGIDARLRPTEGYDGTIEGASLTCDDCRDEDEVDLFSKDERVELADMMIRRWREYREAAALMTCRDGSEQPTNASGGWGSVSISKSTQSQ